MSPFKVVGWGDHLQRGKHSICDCNVFGPTMAVIVKGAYVELKPLFCIHNDQFGHCDMFACLFIQNFSDE